MEYQMNLGGWGSIFAVPCAVVDQQLKLAGALQLKVLLWVLRNNGAPFTMAALAAATGASEADARDALLYWTETGILHAEEGQFSPGQAAAAESPFVPAETAAPVVPVPEAPAKKAPPRLRHPKPDPVYILSLIHI